MIIKVQYDARFLCPITHEVMEEPVTLCDGHTYERSAIERWLKKSNISPMTNSPLTTKQYFPNYAMRAMIAETREKAGACALKDLLGVMRKKEYDRITHMRVPLEYVFSKWDTVVCPIIFVWALQKFDLALESIVQEPSLIDFRYNDISLLELIAIHCSMKELDSILLAINATEKRISSLLVLPFRIQFSKKVDYLLRRGANVNETDAKGFPALLYAIRLGKYKAAVSVLNQGATIHHESLFVACEFNTTIRSKRVIDQKIRLIHLLLERGVSVNMVRNANLCTPLHLAVSRGFQPMIEVLLQKGAHVEAELLNGKTPLFFAANEAVASLLLSYGADPLHKDKRGDMAFSHLSHDIQTKILVQYIEKIRDEREELRDKKRHKGEQ